MTDIQQRQIVILCDNAIFFHLTYMSEIPKCIYVFTCELNLLYATPRTTHSITIALTA